MYEPTADAVVESVGAVYPAAVAAVSLFTNPVTVIVKLGVSPYFIVSPAYVAVNCFAVIFAFSVSVVFDNV